MEAARRLRVLIVDDNEYAATALARLVAACGYEVRTAFGGIAACIWAKSFGPDVVLWGFGDAGHCRLQSREKPESSR